MRVLVLYESRRGFTLTVARALRDGLRASGVEATAAPLRGVDAGTLAAADALVVGTWVKGMIVVGVGPASGTREGVDAGDPDRLARSAWSRCSRPRRVPAEEESADRPGRRQEHPGRPHVGALTGRGGWRVGGWRS
jgi:hypothetical protein